MKTDLVIAGFAFVVISAFLYFFYMKKITPSKSKKKKKKEAREIIEIRYLMITYNSSTGDIFTFKLL